MLSTVHSGALMGIEAWPIAVEVDTKELTIYTNDIYFMVMDTAKLFMNGRSQAVRLPKEYRFRGSRVYVRKVGKGVLLMPEEETWDTLMKKRSAVSSGW